MASWGLDDRGGLFSTATYGDVGFLVADPDPASSKKTFASVGNISNVLGPLYAKILGEDEPFRKRRLTGHVFEGRFEQVHVSEVMADVVRYGIIYTITGKTELIWTRLGSHPDLRSGAQRPSPTGTNSRYIRNRKRTQKKRVRGGRVL
jgi:mRNA-degrading endonuclease YafQ of YafQ-DinJ toxin-antitoxin module